MTAAADFRGIDTWLFDLDHTLYPPTAPVLGLIEARIKAYMARLTGLPPEEAWALQKDYLARYGGAVAGLLEHHDVDVADFMAEIHDVPLDGVTAIRRSRRPWRGFREGGWCSPTVRRGTRSASSPGWTSPPCSGMCSTRRPPAM